MAAILAGLSLLVFTSRTRAEENPYDHLASALYEMQEAKIELKEERFKRHQEHAIRDLDVAIEETEKAIKEAKLKFRRYERRENPKEVYRAYKDYPHLRHAIVELHEAKREIEREKRGEFFRAIKFIDVAIVRVEDAIRDEK